MGMAKATQGKAAAMVGNMSAMVDKMNLTQQFGDIMSMRTMQPPELRVCDPQKVKKGVTPYIVYRVIVSAFCRKI